MADETNMELVRLITEDLNKHRDYVQKLYTRAFIAGGLIVTAVLGAGFWFLSDRVNNELIQYLLTKKVTSIVEPLANEEAARAFPEITEKAIDKAYAVVDIIIDERVNDGIESSLDAKLLDFSNTRLEELIALYLESNKSSYLPTSMVAAFNSNRCPPGWEVYTPAEEGIIVGKRYFNAVAGTRAQLDATLINEEPSTLRIMYSEHITNTVLSRLQLQELIEGYEGFGITYEEPEKLEKVSNTIDKLKKEIESLNYEISAMEKLAPPSDTLPITVLTYCQQVDEFKLVE